MMEIVRKHFKTIDSTNTWAKQHALEFPHGKLTLVTADEQTAGRGRFKRTWVSPPNENLYATFCFFMEKHRTDIGNTAQVLSISAAKTLMAFDFQPTLKWPNDILLRRKKVAGILCETTPFSDRLCIVAGIGINVNMPLETLQKIDRPATSLFVEGNVPMAVGKILERLQGFFNKDLDLFLEDGFFPFLDTYKSYMTQYKKARIRFDDNRSIWEGTFENINNDGSLNMKLDSGEIKTFVAGEILF